MAIAATRVFFSLYENPPDMSACVKEIVRGEGIIESEPTRTETGQVLVVRAEKLVANSEDCVAEAREAPLIRMKSKLYPKFSFGERVSFSGKLGEPFNFVSNSGRAFDFRGYLAKDDIYFEIKSAAVSAISYDQNKTISGFITSNLYKLKRGFVNNLESVLGEPHSALAAGLVVGEKSALGKDLINDFRIVGLIHIVVLSGFNITIVADAIRKMLMFLPRVWGIVLGGIGIGLFGILVGGGSTVVRSCFMAGIALSADLIRRDYSVTRALIFAGLIMIIQNPKILLHDPSFQLSFLATLGLIILATPIEKKLSFVTEKLGMRGILAATFATQIFVSPYILYMMGQLSVISVFANILVLPLIPFTMLFVFLTGAVGFVSHSASALFAWVSHILLSYELLIVESFSQIPHAAVNVPIFSFFWVIVFYSVLAVVFTFAHFRNSFLQRSNSG